MSLAELGPGGAVTALVAAILLGLRHATDPDHLTAVSTLVLGRDEAGARGAGLLGLCWGAGHAATLVAFGLPLVFAGPYLPETVQRGAEIAIGVVIVALAGRLLVRWKRGYFHAHPHAHGDLVHAHPHAHEEAHPHRGHPPAHDHHHAEALGSSPLAAFAIGLVHGLGGSAAVGILVVASIPGPALASAALMLFASATALSMAAVSWALGRALEHGPVARRLETLVPAFGAFGVAFGIWHAFGAPGAAAYPF